MRYSFKSIEKCNMCFSSSSSDKILGRRLNQSQGRNPKNKIGISTTVVKCANCGLIYSNPQPIPNDIQDHYGVPPEDYWTEEYFTIDYTSFDHDIDRLKQLIEFHDDMKFLDIGSGLGKQMVIFEKNGFDVYGFEPSVPFYERAIEKIGIPKEKLKLAQIEDVDYPANSFDYISFGVVLEHLYDPSESIQKAIKWLKPNGIIHIEVPSSKWLISKIINLYYRLRGTDNVSNISPMHPPYHLFEFTLKSFQFNGEINGYEIAHYDTYICDTYMPRLFDYPLKTIMKMTGTGMQLSVWLRKKAV